MGAHEGTSADRSDPRGSEREGERGRAGVGTDRRGPPVRHRGHAGVRARARAGLSGPTWAELGFSIFQGISNFFSFYFL